MASVTGSDVGALCSQEDGSDALIAGFKASSIRELLELKEQPVDPFITKVANIVIVFHAWI